MGPLPPPPPRPAVLTIRFLNTPQITHQAVEELLAQRLAADPQWSRPAGPGQGTWEQLPGAAVEDPRVAAAGDAGDAGPCASRREPAATEPTSARGAGERARSGTLASGVTLRPLEEEPEPQRGASPKWGKLRNDEGAGVGSGPPTAAVEVAGGTEPGTSSLRLISEAVSRSVALSDEDRAEWRQLEELERRLLSAYRAALTEPGVAPPPPLVVLHDSEVRGDPLLARHVTAATTAEVAAALVSESVLLPLVLQPECSDGGGRDLQHGAEGGEVAEARTPLAKVELGPVAAATSRARSRGGFWGCHNCWVWRVSCNLGLRNSADDRPDGPKQGYGQLWGEG